MMRAVLTSTVVAVNFSGPIGVYVEAELSAVSAETSPELVEAYIEEIAAEATWLPVTVLPADDGMHYSLRVGPVGTVAELKRVQTWMDGLPEPLDISAENILLELINFHFAPGPGPQQPEPEPCNTIPNSIWRIGVAAAAVFAVLVMFGLACISRRTRSRREPVKNNGGLTPLPLPIGGWMPGCGDSSSTPSTGRSLLRETQVQPYEMKTTNSQALSLPAPTTLPPPRGAGAIRAPNGLPPAFPTTTPPRTRNPMLPPPNGTPPRYLATPTALNSKTHYDVTPEKVGSSLVIGAELVEKPTGMNLGLKFEKTLRPQTRRCRRPVLPRLRLSPAHLAYRAALVAVSSGTPTTGTTRSNSTVDRFEAHLTSPLPQPLKTNKWETVLTCRDDTSSTESSTPTV